MTPAAARRRARSNRRAGVSLAESITAMGVLTVAGAAALTALSAGIRGADEAARLTFAAGLADDLAAEAFSLPVRRPADRSPHAGTRDGFDDADDFRDYESGDFPVRPDGRPVGVPGTATGRPGDSDADLAQLRTFVRAVAVEPVSPAAAGDGTAGGGWDAAAPAAPHRRVTVRVYWRGAGGTGRRLAAERVAVLVRGGD